MASTIIDTAAIAPRFIVRLLGRWGGTFCCLLSLALVTAVVQAQPGAPKAGTILKDCPMCPELVVLPKGSFVMGSPPTDIDSPFRERPQRHVTIGMTLAMGRYEVTRAEFEAFARDGGWVLSSTTGCKIWSPTDPISPPFREVHASRVGEGPQSFADPGFEQAGDHPVTCVSWEDAQAYVAWLNKIVGTTLAFRLPSEAEWEYAARAGRGSERYPWGEDMETRAQCRWANGADQSFLQLRRHTTQWEVAACNDRHTFTAPAKAFKPNAFGLFNMHGNVWEWVLDRWHDDYEGAPVDGSDWQHIDAALLKAWNQSGSPAIGANVLRGGSWSSPPENLRSASRSYHFYGGRLSSVGFRVVRVVRE